MIESPIGHPERTREGSRDAMRFPFIEILREYTQDDVVNDSVPGHWTFGQSSLIRYSGFSMPDIDLFNFFRWWLSWIVTIYASILTLQSLWNWYVWLAGQDKYIGILRRYLIVHGLRLRFKAF